MVTDSKTPWDSDVKTPVRWKVKSPRNFRSHAEALVVGVEMPWNDEVSLQPRGLASWTPEACPNSVEFSRFNTFPGSSELGGEKESGFEMRVISPAAPDNRNVNATITRIQRRENEGKRPTRELFSVVMFVSDVSSQVVPYIPNKGTSLYNFFSR